VSRLARVKVPGTGLGADL